MIINIFIKFVRKYFFYCGITARMRRQNGATYHPNKMYAKTHNLQLDGHTEVDLENGHTLPAQLPIEILQYA